MGKTEGPQGDRAEGVEISSGRVEETFEDGGTECQVSVESGARGDAEVEEVTHWS